MSNPSDDRMPLDDFTFDRLVDGELSDRERRALLERLDREPDGWKRCALAFLEAQCWRESAGLLDELKPVVALQSAPQEPRIQARRPIRWPGRSALAVAAACVGAFLLGIVAAGPLRNRGDLPGQIAQQAPSAAPAQQRADRDVASSPRTAMPLPRMALVNVGGPDPATYEVPVVPAAGVDWRWLERPPSPVPQNLMRQWQRQGYEVAQRRRLVSTELPSGELVAVPIDEVELRYVGQRLY